MLNENQKKTEEEGFYAKFDISDNCLLEQDFEFIIEINKKTYCKFWLNSNFIPKFFINKYNKELIIVPEEFSPEYLNFSPLILFEDHSLVNEKKEPLIFKQNPVKIHSETVKYLKKKVEIEKEFNPQNKNISSKYALQLLNLKEMDNKRKMINSKLVGENFCVNLVFLENY